MAKDAAAKQRSDSWASAVTGLGGSRDKASSYYIAQEALCTQVQLDAMYMGDDLAATIVDAPVEDALSRGIEITGEDTGALARAFEALGGPKLFVDAAIWGRLYGGGAIFLATKGLEGYERPLGENHGPLLYALVLDRWETTPQTYYRDPTSPRYGQVETYRITPGAQGVAQNGELAGQLVHESRLILFGGARTTNRTRQRNGGWDVSVLQRAQSIIRDAGINWQSSVLALQDLSQSVFKIQGLIEMIAEGKKGDLLTRMELVDMSRSVARAVVLDAEMESFENVGAANLAAVPAILDKTFSRVATVAHMPLTRLMGVSPGGMNATGESDLSWWYGQIDVYRELTLKPKILQFLKVLAKSLNIPTDKLDVAFPPLWQMSQKETAELRKLTADTDAVYISNQVVLPEEIALSRFGSGKWSPDTQIDLSVPRDAAPAPVVPGVPDFAGGLQ
jgi:phage-related protein (TIGR01555 family)